MLRYKRINSQFFTDTLFVTTYWVSTRGNNLAQIFVINKGFMVIYAMESKRDFPYAFHMFFKEVRVTLYLIFDPLQKANF